MRYSERPLPPYRHVPGDTPHPRRDPGGHARGVAESVAGPWRAEDWRGNDLWLHAVDLFNHGYWWECHEALETLWHAAGRTSPEARFVQGLILVAAALLNHHRGKPAALRQAERGLRRMESASGRVDLGLDVARLGRAVRAHFAGGPPPVIRLAS